MFREYWNLLRLNLRAARLATSGIWMTHADVAVSYDALAETYDERWASQLRTTTNRLHERLPDVIPNGAIIELGCGSGASTVFLQGKYSELPLIAVDVSAGMIEHAKNHPCPSKGGELVEFHVADMLAFLRQRPTNESALIFSGWAIGYSRPAAIIAEARRVLQPGGYLAVVVNRFDTMPAVFNAFRQAMRQYPESLNKALLPRFPKSAAVLAKALAQNDLRTDFLDEGATPIDPPSTNRLDWLLGTGILAGFDAVLPLRQSGQVRDFLAKALDQTESGWEHRYVMFVAKKV
jgi:ubiquinone/menaquinone biosynthesis C-methylase UbiE